MATKHEREIVAVRLQNATLDEKTPGLIVAHGWLDLAALLELRVGDYQREILETAQSTSKKKNKILDAIERGERLPDVILGMRGERYDSRGGTYYLNDDVYIIDGLQRISNLRRFATQNPDRVGEVRIGAEVRFNTTRESEKELFTVLNVNRTAMSPNVLLRNMRESSHGLLTLYGLTHNDPSFALYGKVSWNQKMGRNELMTAAVYTKSVIHLHRSHGALAPTSVMRVPGVLQDLADEVGLQTLRGNFLNTLAKMFAGHENFWDEKRLVIDAKQRQRLKSFPLNDPNVQKLSGAGQAAADLLLRLMIDHMNKGQKINRLIPREIVDRRVGKNAAAGHKRRVEKMRERAAAKAALKKAS